MVCPGLYSESVLVPKTLVLKAHGGGIVQSGTQACSGVALVDSLVAHPCG